MPTLSVANVNKQEYLIFQQMNQSYQGTTQSDKRLIVAEEQREKELLEKLYALRKDNNEKRKRIEELQNTIKGATEAVTQKKAILSSVKSDNSR